MQVYKIFPKGFASNCYLLTADGKTAVAIDPAQPCVLQEAEKRGLTVAYVLLTHGHFDHIGGCSALSAAGAKICCSQEEKALVLGENNMASAFGRDVPPFSIDVTFRDGEILDLCGMKIKVIATPGHTEGSVCFLCEDALFTGDTLFCGDVGRTDLPTGSAEALQQSIRKLYAMEGDYAVYPGHDEDTTLQKERMTNEWVRA